MPFLEYNGVKTYFRKFGEKRDLPPLIFIHGVAANHLSWYSQIKFFSELTEFYVLDLPGHGKSDIPTVEDLPTLYINIIRQLILEEKIENPVLIGHSMGGGIVQLAAISYPELINKAILVCTGVNLGFKINLTTPVKKVLKKILSLFGWKVYCIITSKFTAKHEIPGLKGINLEARMSATCSGKTFLDIIGFLLSIDLSEEIKSVNLPMLFITGTKDMFFNQVGFYRKLPNVQIKIIEGGEHILQLLNKETNYHILNFIKG